MKYQFLLLCFMLLIGGTSTIASGDNTIKPYVASSFLYDNNFLRVSDDVDPVLAAGEDNLSEFIKQIRVGFDMDWTISRQRFIIKANANQNWFQNFTTLDYFGWDTLAQWNWQIGNKMNGEIGYANIRELGSFVQLNQLIPNLQNNQRYFANASYLFHPKGKIKFGLFRSEYKYDGEGRQFSNNTEDNAELNLQYLSSTSSILGVQILATDGQYPKRQFDANSADDNAYTRMLYALIWDWHASSKTHIDGLLGYTQQSHEHLSASDFADIVAQINLHWQASDKTLLEFSARREISQAQNVFSSFLLNQGIYLNITYQFSPKTTFIFPMFYQHQDYLGGGGSPNVGDFEQQKDRVGRIGFNLMYNFLENIKIGAMLNYEKRDSNNPFRSYETQSAGVNLQASF